MITNTTALSSVTVASAPLSPTPKNQSVHNSQESCDALIPFNESEYSIFLGSLLKAGLTDNLLNFPDHLQGKGLPEVQKEEIQNIISIFEEAIDVIGKYNGNVFKRTLKEHLIWFFNTYPNVESVTIAGSKALKNALGPIWFKRYCDALGHPELFNLLPKNCFEEKSSDLDLSFIVRGATLSTLIPIGHHASQFLLGRSSTEPVSVEDQDNYFAKCGPFNNVRQGFTLKFGSNSRRQIDMTFKLSEWENSFISDHDCLSITIDRNSFLALMGAIEGPISIKIDGQVHSGWSAPAFLAAKAMRVPQHISLYEVVHYFTRYVKGFTCPLLCDEEKIVSLIVAEFGDSYKKHCALELLSDKLSTNLPSTPEAKGAFCYNLCALFHRHGHGKYIDQAFISKVLKTPIEGKPNLLTTIGTFLWKHPEHFQLLHAYLTVQANFLSLRQNVLDQNGPIVTSKSDNLTNPLKHLCIYDPEDPSKDPLHLPLYMDFMTALKVLKDNSEHLDLLKGLDEYFYSGIKTFNITNVLPKSEKDCSKEIALGLSCLRTEGFEEHGFNLLCYCSAITHSSKHLKELTESLISLISKECSTDKKRGIVYHYMYLCQSLGYHLPKNLSESLENLISEKSIENSLVHLCELLVWIPNQAISNVLTSLWKKIPIEKTVGVIEKNIQVLPPETVLKILRDLISYPEIKNELLLSLFHIVCKHLRRKPLDAESKVTLMTLKSEALSLLKRKNDHKGQNLEGKDLYWVAMQLCDLNPADALELIKALGNNPRFIDSKNASQPILLQITRAAFSQKHVFSNWSKRNELLTLLTKKTLSTEDQSFFTQQIRILFTTNATNVQQQGPKKAKGRAPRTKGPDPKNEQFGQLKTMASWKFLKELYPNEENFIELLLFWVNRNPDVAKGSNEPMMREAFQLLISSCAWKMSEKTALDLLQTMGKFDKFKLVQLLNSLMRLNKFTAPSLLPIVTQMALLLPTETCKAVALIPVLTLLAAQPHCLDLEVALAKEILQSCAKNIKDIKSYNPFKTLFTQLIMRLAVERGGIEECFALINHEHASLLFNKVELAAGKGTLFILFYKKCQIEFSSTSSSQLIRLFLREKELIASNVEVLKKCLYFMGRLLVSVYFFHDNKAEYSILVDQFLVKYGDLAFAEFILRDKELIQTLRNKYHREKNSKEQGELFYCFLHGLVDQWAYQSISNEEDYNGVNIEANLTICAMANFFPEKAEQIYAMVYGLAFNVPNELIYIPAHFQNIILILRYIKTKLPPIDPQMDFELKVLLELKYPEDTSLPDDKQIESFFKVMKKFVQQSSVSVACAFPVMLLLPKHLLKASLKEFADCYKKAIETLKRILFLDNEELAMSNILFKNLLELGRNCVDVPKDICGFDFSSLISKYFNFIKHLQTQNKNRPIDQALYVNHLKDCLITLASEKSISNQMKSILLRYVVNLSVESAKRGKPIKLVPLFLSMKVQFKDDINCKKSLMIIVNFWITELRKIEGLQDFEKTEHEFILKYGIPFMLPTEEMQTNKL